MKIDITCHLETTFKMAIFISCFTFYIVLSLYVRRLDELLPLICFHDEACEACCFQSRIAGKSDLGELRSKIILVILVSASTTRKRASEDA